MVLALAPPLLFVQMLRGQAELELEQQSDFSFLEIVHDLF